MTVSKLARQALVLVAFSGLVVAASASGVGRAAASMLGSGSQTAKTVEAPVFIDTRRLADVLPAGAVVISQIENDDRRFAD